MKIRKRRSGNRGAAVGSGRGAHPESEPTATPDGPEATPIRITAVGVLGLVGGVLVGITNEKQLNNALAVLAFLFGGGGLLQVFLSRRGDAVALLVIAGAVGILAGIGSVILLRNRGVVRSDPGP